MTVKNPSNPLAFLLSGFEHGGTTLISEILRQHPKLDSGFEGGLLLTKKLKQFIGYQPFEVNFKNGWKISGTQLTDICNSSSYGEAYLKTRAFSDVILDKSCKVFDKTPRYLQKLPAVMHKVPDIKVLIIIRDMRSIIDSTMARSNDDTDSWIKNTYPLTRKHTLSYLDGLTVALNDSKLQDRIKVIRYEEFVTDQENICKDFFKFLGYTFKPEYLKFKNSRYRQVHGEGIQTEYLTKYKKRLPASFEETILNDFSSYSEYFWMS